MNNPSIKLKENKATDQMELWAEGRLVKSWPSNSFFNGDYKTLIWVIDAAFEEGKRVRSNEIYRLIGAGR